MPAAETKQTVNLQVEVDADLARRIRALSILNSRKMQVEVEEALSLYLASNSDRMPVARSNRA